MYLRYCRAKQAAEVASANVRACYAQVVAAVANKTLVLNVAYGAWKLSTIWEAGPLAWRPRPLHEYKVVCLPTLTPESASDCVQSVPNDPHGLLAEYARLSQIESDAYSAEGAAYKDLITAFVCGQLPVTEAGYITQTPAVVTGLQQVHGTVRVFILKPAVEPVKKARK